MISAALCLALLLQPTLPHLELRALELDVRLDPSARQLTAKAQLDLRSRRVLLLETLVLVLPSPFAARAEIETVWDDTGLLAWHAERREESLFIHVALAKPLAPLGRRTVVVSFRVDFAGLDSPASSHLSENAVRLESRGWYPLPTEGVGDALRRVRLGVRLPHTWRVRPMEGLKRLRTGTQFAEYERKARNVPTGQLLFSARAE